MTINKNQHFVPRCHLRPFTLDSKNAAINVFNLERKKLITNAPVKNQCSGDYFYGQDQRLEDAIQSLESGYAQALRSLMNDSRLLSEENQEAFKFFWIFQHMRTEAAAKSMVAMADSFKGLAEEESKSWSLSIKQAVQMACRSYVDSMHEIDDLKFCILKNKTPIPFITSDNPAVLTNMWRLIKNRSPGRSFGIGSAGLITILPLSPRLLFLGYDGDVYSVPNERGIVEVKSSRDAIALNRHQFLQCASNVYVHDHAQKDSLTTQFEDIATSRPKTRHVVNYAQFDRIVGNYTRYEVMPREELDNNKEAMLHSQVIHPHPGIWPTQIRIRSKGRVYTNGTGLGYVRLSRASQGHKQPFWHERP